MRGTVKRIQPIAWLCNYMAIVEGWECARVHSWIGAERRVGDGTAVAHPM